VVDLLQKRIDRASLDESETKALGAFDKLRDEATAAARDFRTRVTADEIAKLVESFGEDRTAFERQALRERIDKLLDADR